MKKWVRQIIFIVALCVFAFSGYKLYSIYSDYKEVEDNYSSLAQIHSTKIPELKEPYIIVDMDSLVERNKDCVGWIYIPDTKINYPVMLGKTNESYLYTTIDRKYNFAGTPFLDYRQNGTFKEANTVIYSHNMKNGSMFNNLEKFKKQSFVDEHPYVYIFYKDGSCGKYQIYSCYIGDGRDEDIYDFSVKDGAKYQQDTQKRSLIVTDAVLDGSKPVITLSTCVTQTSLDRILVHAILVDIIE